VSVFAKLNLGAHTRIHVLNAPASFVPVLEALSEVDVRSSLGARDRTRWVIGFAITQAELDATSTKIGKAAEGDAVVWIAYPKKSSKRYRCEFDRDSGWTALGAAGFEPVRMVAIDDDWSALRFRKAEHIKTLTRSADWAISDVGKQKAGAPKKR
jgi:hypothetical protein